MVFDIEQQRMCVRVVYDGAASAGKTTNLKQLAELFATQRTCELFSPAEMDGRTLYFDWLQIAAGMVCGFPLVCQVITVPGQQVLTPRRRHLLTTADVVVHVCDSDGLAVSRAVEGLTLFDQVEVDRAERIPLVIQANKQDQPGALAGAAVLALIGRPAVPIVEAIASDGIGVVDTFVAAVRAAVRAIQGRVEKGDFKIGVQRAESADDVLAKLSAEEVDPEWAVEMLLEEASNSFVVGERLDDEHEGNATADDPPETWRPERVAAGAPVFPTEHVPTGFVWPAHTGRAALRALASEPEMKRAVSLDGDGLARLVAGEFVISTGYDQRFDSSEAARQALVRAARERTQLGSLLAPETVLVAQPAGEDASWLWTILPRVPSVAQLVASADRPDLTRSAVLAAFGASLADALKVEAAHGMALDLSPRTFGLSHGSVRYLGEISGSDVGHRDTLGAIREAFADVAAIGGDVELALAAFESAVASKLSGDDLAKLGRSPATGVPTSPPSVLPDVARRVELALNRGQRAA